MRIDGQQFTLDDDTDVVALKRDVLEATRGAGAFVDVRAVGHGVVSVLVTPRTAVRLAVEERSPSPGWTECPPLHDLTSDYDDEALLGDR